MKKQFLHIICLFCGVLSASAQKTPYIFKPEPHFGHGLILQMPQRLFPDSLQNNKQYPLMPYRQEISAMSRQFYFLGNNGKSMDIYQTPADNMFIIKPDATFTSNMPVAANINLQYKPIAMPNPRMDMHY